MSMKRTWPISNSISFLISAGIQEVTLHYASFVNLLLVQVSRRKAADYSTILRKYVVKLRLSAKRSHERASMPFLLSHFSPGEKIENCSAQFLAVCWIVRVEFKVQRPRDGLSVSNALLLDQSLPALIGHNLDQIGDGTLLQRGHLFEFVSLLLTHRQVELPFVLVLFEFWHSQFFRPVFRSRRLKAIIL